ncbi:unnamed protein product [Somion occarium]|uniref:Chitin-binding type-3 domain-containing protein n=1 Tax=Somion occarium TaxID=3059160 RepID=A0ABP1DLR1_9APHY
MTIYNWEPDTQYNLGDVVVYEGTFCDVFNVQSNLMYTLVCVGHKYKIVQAHRSQADWAPPVVPALWERVHEEYHGGEQQHYEQPQYGQPQQPQQQPGYNPGYSYGAPPDQGGYKYQGNLGDEKHPDQTVEIKPEEQKKNWYDLDDDRKKKLEIGGGLLAGIAAVGAGYYAYHEHEKSEEEKKANIWALQSWLKEARARTDDFYRNGPRAPTTWILVEGKNIPQGALPGGEENGQPLYICRAFHEGSLQIGKASPVFKEGAVIGYAHKEIHLPTYEVLLGDPRAVRWVDFHGRLDLARLGARPVEGGREAKGTPLFIAQAHHKNAIHPGKISEKLDSAFIPYGGGEKEIKDYRVLCYN